MQVPRPLGGEPVTWTHRRLLIGDMARALLAGNVDLGDKRAAVTCLRRTHREGDVIALLDDAICRARELLAALARPGG